jgi:error-prone DNA polymerase
MPAAEINLIAKSPYGLREKNVKTPLAKMVITMARRLEGLPRHLSMHPCAIVLSDGGLLDRVPLQRNASGYPMVEFDKDDVEDVGLLKLDILGVRMQSSISYALSEISRVHNEEVDIDAIALDDPHTYELIQSTKTIGIFQIESPGQRELVGKLEPQTFTDLIIDISLFRPGPVKSDMISPFLKSRHGWSARKIIHPDLYTILRDTEGVVVFHEQVISIIATMTHCSLAHADEMRRALGDRQGQQKVCDWFYPAATEHGYSPEVINEVWEVLRAFASFGFCKAHAAAFAFPTYQSAWLKTHYPAAFLAGLLTHDPGMYPKRLILDEVRQMGISIAPLDVNNSDQSYRVEIAEDGTQSIRIALSTINGISTEEIENIITARPYKDLADFYYRSGASQPIIESLILTGAFDRLHAITNTGVINRRDLLLHFSDLIKGPTMPSALRSQMTLGFEAPALEASGLPDLGSNEKVAHEVKRLGMDITHHMLEFYSHFLNSIGAIKSSDLLSVRSASTVLVAGVRVSIQTPPVRSGKRVIFLTLNDGHGCSDATFFSDVATEYLSTIYTSELVLLRGVTRRTGARGISIRATGIWDLRAAYEKWNTQRSTLAI